MGSSFGRSQNVASGAFVRCGCPPSLSMRALLFVSTFLVHGNEKRVIDDNIYKSTSIIRMFISLIQEVGCFKFFILNFIHSFFASGLLKDRPNERNLRN